VLQRTCCASFGYYPMSTTDSISAPGADRFRSELRQLIAQAASMAPDAAAKIMRQFLSDSHDCWPQIRGDIETNANLRALHERAFEIRDAPTAEATARWKQRNSGEHRRDGEVRVRQHCLYWNARAGWAASEYNLAAAGMIEMIYGHHAGLVHPNEFFWDDLRWTLTDRGRRASDAQLERIMLRDPPLEIAEWDAENEANDVAGDCGGCDTDDSYLEMHKRISINLDKRAERINQKMARRAKLATDARPAGS
jgi:hypothetical protein